MLPSSFNFPLLFLGTGTVLCTNKVFLSLIRREKNAGRLVPSTVQVGKKYEVNTQYKC
jgi:hypothetical protein